jgi:peroxiredoxin family protein
MSKPPLAIAVHADAYDRVHYALVLAATAAALGRTATLFFAGPAVRALITDGWQQLPGADQDEDRLELGTVGFIELRDACRDLGVRVIACEADLRLARVPVQRIDPAWGAEVAGAASFLAAGDQGQVLFI